MMPDQKTLVTRLGLTNPLLGMYDSPDTRASSLSSRSSPASICASSDFTRTSSRATLQITKDNFGCGAGSHLCGVQTRSREDYVTFLFEGEGLKATRPIMENWFDKRKPYEMENPYILMGRFARRNTSS